MTNRKIDKQTNWQTDKQTNRQIDKFELSVGWWIHQIMSTTSQCQNGKDRHSPYYPQSVMLSYVDHSRSSRLTVIPRSFLFNHDAGGGTPGCNEVVNSD